jgi:Putative MetA-pathway of phenol degradation
MTTAERFRLAMAALTIPTASAFADGTGAGEGSPASTPGETASKDKSSYTIFNPVPRDLMRELSPDRPDKTESPYTVDAGHFQLEMDFANFTLDESNCVRTRAWNVAPFNVKIGLFNNVDLHFVFDDYLWIRTHDRATRTTTTQSGAGDFTSRLKINLWGDDGGSTALGFLPFVKFPTNTELGNNSVEGGVLFPFAAKLPAGFDMGMETGVRLLRNEVGRSYHEQFVNSVTFGHALIGKLDGYLEFFSSVSTERGSQWIGTIDFGLTYPIAENVQLDCGCNARVTGSADDLNTFTGITVRF